jgi:hypothetical protein
MLHSDHKDKCIPAFAKPHIDNCTAIPMLRKSIGSLPHFDVFLVTVLKHNTSFLGRFAGQTTKGLAGQVGRY